MDAPAPERDATRLAAAYVAGDCVGDDPALKAGFYDATAYRRLT